MNILDYLIDEDKREYKCYSILKTLLEENEEFRNIIIEGIKEGKIRPFDQELWDKIRNQNIRRINNFEDVFRDGANIGYCTVVAKQVSYSLDKCYICGGYLPILKGTFNCLEGKHTWILYNNEIIDTSLMLIIDKDYALKLGYIQENKYDPTENDVYNAAKDFANDKELRKNKSSSR